MVTPLYYTDAHVARSYSELTRRTDIVRDIDSHLGGSDRTQPTAPPSEYAVLGAGRPGPNVRHALETITNYGTKVRSPTLHTRTGPGSKPDRKT